MSAVWLKLITIVCLSGTALSGPEKSEVMWRDVGATITIQCRSEPNQEHLALRRGIREEVQIFYKAGISEKDKIAPEFKGRLQLNGVFPNMDFLMKNLTSDDTGPYWCEYSKFDEKSNLVTEKGNGSVLLVVRGADKAQQCESSTNNHVLMGIVITAVFTIMSCLIWIILKTRTCSNTTANPRSIATNDVYEDMRGTLRR